MIFKRASVNDVKRMFEHIRDKFSEISSGAASSLLGRNLTAGKVLVSDADGKVSASETGANQITYFYGSSDEVNAALAAGELEIGTNILCENDTEFVPNYNITEDRAVITNAAGEFAPSDVTAQELGYLSGVTGNVQSQINSLIYKTDILPENLMVNVDYNKAYITQINEYFRYTLIGNICIVEIGGIVLNIDQAGIVCTELPIAITRPLGLVYNNIDQNINALIYGIIGETKLYMQSNAKIVGKALYGQILYAAQL